jgi:hypothetical protein
MKMGLIIQIITALLTAVSAVATLLVERQLEIPAGDN